MKAKTIIEDLERLKARVQNPARPTFDLTDVFVIDRAIKSVGILNELIRDVEARGDPEEYLLITYNKAKAVLK